MSIFLRYLAAFAVGGLVCLIGQLLINTTKMTSSRILVIFLLLGAFLEAIGVFKYIENFAGAGITVPITGFGATLVRGALKGLSEKGLIGVLYGGIEAGAAGLGSAILFGFLMSVIFKARTKT
ncbi:MAG: SpoVA/SpoVAEb family sporulation membrane protein [Clostridia bacterium]|nr:SpoVA/SpoVAEb family sporulation membrane protein [Clostridia bacterium]